MKKINLSSNFLSSLYSGKINIKCNETPSINFSVNDDIRIIDVLDLPSKLTSKIGLIKQLSVAKDLAKNLKKDGITLEIRFKGEPVLKLGKKANPKLAKIVTLSNNIEITDLKKLNKLKSMI